ncbi:uncharacterized protein LOC143291963 [Babylonia areolata]|uniref:uncharacterized protein LOC143291963 n=1 Tax=Babylonia areolata TaxID=304850 RepID=UPI003FD676EF
MSTWVNTVLLSFGKALLISLSILIGSCCLRFLYRFWTRRLGCKHPSVDDLSESYKYEMELQAVQEMSHRTTSSCSHAHDAHSEMELPPSPGANTSCPPYNSNCLYPDKPRYDDFSVSDSYSGKWSTNNIITPDGEDTTTDADLTSVAGETTTMCSVLTSNEEQQQYYDTASAAHTAEPSPQPPAPGFPKLSPLPPPAPKPPAAELHQDYQNYKADTVVRPLPRPPAARPRKQHDRGTELFLSQYYKSLEHERTTSNSRSPPPPL